MWEVAKNVLPLGISVILDFGFWARSERDDYRQRASDLNVDLKIHFMNASKEDLLARLEERNRQVVNDDETWYIPPVYVEEWYEKFEPPTPEGLS